MKRRVRCGNKNALSLTYWHDIRYVAFIHTFHNTTLPLLSSRLLPSSSLGHHHLVVPGRIQINKLSHVTSAGVIDNVMSLIVNWSFCTCAEHNYNISGTCINESFSILTFFSKFVRKNLLRKGYQKAFCWGRKFSSEESTFPSHLRNEF